MPNPTLSVISGGGGQPRRRPFHEHPLALDLWKAIYPRPASSLGEIAERMSVSTGEQVDYWAANNCLHHIRKHADDYGWTIPHVRKGRAKDRKFFPLTVDPASNPMRVRDYASVMSRGGVSSTKTIATMARHAGIAFELAAQHNTDLTPTVRRKFAAISSMYMAASELATQLLVNVSNAV